MTWDTLFLIVALFALCLVGLALRTTGIRSRRGRKDDIAVAWDIMHGFPAP